MNTAAVPIDEGILLDHPLESNTLETTVHNSDLEEHLRGLPN